jgi:hypothetical protein
MPSKEASIQPRLLSKAVSDLHLNYYDLSKHQLFTYKGTSTHFFSKDFQQINVLYLFDLINLLQPLQGVYFLEVPH